MCVRVNEKGYIVCARNRECIDSIFVFLAQGLYFFFLFFLKLLSSLKPQSDISLINGRCAFREGERKSRISCDPFESAEKIGG